MLSSHMPWLRRTVRSPYARRLAALAVAAVLALKVPVTHLLDRPRLFVFDTAARADEALAPLRARVAPGERFGIMIGSGNEGTEQALWFSAQYALVPAIVTPIRARDCPSLSAPTCRAREVRHFIAADAPSWRTLDRLGVAPVERVGGVALFRGGAP